MTITRDANGKFHYTPSDFGGGISRSSGPGPATRVASRLPKSRKIKLPGTPVEAGASPDMQSWLSRSPQDKIALMNGDVHDQAKAEALGLLDREGGLTDRAKALGVDPGKVGQPEGPGAVERVFDVLSRPNYAVANSAAQMLGRSQDTKLAEAPDDSTDFTSFLGPVGLAKSLADKVTGNDKGLKVTSKTLEAAKRGFTGEEKTTFSKMYAEDLPEDASTKEKVAAGGLGLISDIVLDPTTYMGLGLAKNAGKLAVGGGKAAETINAASKVEKGLEVGEDAAKIVRAGEKTDTAAKVASNVAQAAPDVEKVTTTATNTGKRIVINPHERSAVKKIYSTEPVLQGGKKGGKAIRDVVATAEKEFKVASKAKGVDTAAPDFLKTQKEVGQKALTAEKAAAQARVEDAVLKMTALRKTDPALKVQLKVLGKPVLESSKAGRSLELADKAFKATKAGDLMRRGFVGAAEIGSKELHSIRRQFANVTAGEYESSLKQLKNVFDGGQIKAADGSATKFAETSAKDRAAITQALESGDKSKLLEKFHPTYDYIKAQLKDIATREVDAGILKESDVLDNYVYHVYRGKRAVPMFGPGSLPKGTKFKTLAEAEKAGARPVMDAADMLAHRLAKSHQVVGRQNLLRYIGDFYGIAEHGKTRMGRSLKESVDKKVLVPGDKVHSSLKGTYLPADVAESTKKMIQQFAREPTTHEFGKYFDKVQAKFKFAMTAPNPGFHLRNLMSDSYMNFLDGVTDPRRYDQAIRVLKAGEKDTGKKLIKVAGEDLTPRDVLRLYEGQGLKAGYFHAETGVMATGASGVGNKVTQAIRSGSEAREDFSRMAHFIDALEKEGAKAKTLEQAATQAAARVKKYNFDYQDLTHFEQTILKRVIPFYTFMRKNIPVQLESLLVHPGKVSGVNKTQQSLETMILGNPDTDEALPGISGVVPEWLREMNPTQIGRETATQDASYLSPDLPYQQAAAMLGGFTESPQKGITQAGREILGSVTPLGKIPAEAAMGRDITTGAPNSRNAALIGANNIPVVRNAISDMGKDEDKKNPEFTINIGGKPVDLPERWINYFSGAGVRKVTPARITSEIMRRDQGLKDEVKAKQKDQDKQRAETTTTNSKAVSITKRKKKS